MQNTYYSDIARKAGEMIPSKGLSDASFSLAGLLVTQAKVEIPAGAQQGDTLVLTQKLPKGIALVPALCRVTKKPGQKVATMWLGDAKNQKRYFTDVYASDDSASSMTLNPGVDALEPALCTPGLPVEAMLFAPQQQNAQVVFTLVFASVA